MNEFIVKEKKKIGDRVALLRKLLHLTQADVAETLGLAKNTYIRLERGISFSDYSLLPVVYLFGMGISEFMNFEYVPTEENLRQHLLMVHNENEKVLHLLEKSPRLVVLLEKAINKSDFFHKPKSVREFRDYLKSEYNAEHTSPEISQALINAVANNLLVRNKEKGRSFVYRMIKKPTK